MKAIILFIANLILITTALHAQTPSWVNTVGSSGIELSGCFDKDPAGNVYMCGKFSGTLDVDPGAGTFFMDGPGQGGTDVGFGGDIFLAKYTSAGNFMWAFSIIGSFSQDIPQDIAVDASDNIYLVGAVNGTSTYPIDAAIRVQ